MRQPTLLLPAIRELEPGRADAALEILRRALSRRKPPIGHRDLRSDDIVRLRAFIEQAIVELEHSD